MFNLLIVATGLFMGQYDDRPSCQNAIRAIYLQQMVPYPERLSKRELEAVNTALDLNLQYQQKYICIPAKKG